MRPALVAADQAPYLCGLAIQPARASMKAALLSDRGVVKVAGDVARKFLNGLITADLARVAPGKARFAALLTPQGKIIADFIVTEADAAVGGGFFLDCPRALALTVVERLNFYKLRAKVIVEDLSETLGIVATWNSAAIPARSALQAPDGGRWTCYSDPRLPELGARCMVPPHAAARAAAEFGAALVEAAEYEMHRIRLGVPRGGMDFSYGDAFPHETDMDELAGLDLDKGCFVGQEVVSRMAHRGTVRTRVVPVIFDGPPPEAGLAVTAGDKNVGLMGSALNGRGLAALRLDRVEEALTIELPLSAGGIELKPLKPHWARFPFPGEAKVGG
jgi:tRNA-modifying protein YgfZ